MRQAVYQAIDVEAIRNDIMRGYATPAGMIIQPRINGYTPDFDTRLAFDLDAARSLLAEAGYPDGFEVGLECPRNRYFNDEATYRAVVAMLAEVGIVVDLAIAPWASTSPSCASGGPTSACWGGGHSPSIPTAP